MADPIKTIKSLHMYCDELDENCPVILLEALELLENQTKRLNQYRFIEMLIGTSGTNWVDLMLEGKAELDCKTNDRKNKTVITLKKLDTSIP